MTDRTAPEPFGALTTRPPLDPELAPAEEARGDFFPALSDETLPEIRRQIAAGTPGLDSEALTAGGRVWVEERQVPGPEGAPDITVLILSPVEDRGPKGGILSLHGGGMIMGGRRDHVGHLLPHVIDGSAVVVPVEYRLAPDHPDPAPVEDCYAGLVWMAKNAAELGIERPASLAASGWNACPGPEFGFPSAAEYTLARDSSTPRTVSTHSSRPPASTKASPGATRWRARSGRCHSHSRWPSRSEVQRLSCAGSVVNAEGMVTTP